MNLIYLQASSHLLTCLSSAHSQCVFPECPVTGHLPPGPRPSKTGGQPLRVIGQSQRLISLQSFDMPWVDRDDRFWVEGVGIWATSSFITILNAQINGYTGYTGGGFQLQAPARLWTSLCDSRKTRRRCCCSRGFFPRGHRAQSADVPAAFHQLMFLTWHGKAYPKRLAACPEPPPMPASYESWAACIFFSMEDSSPSHASCSRKLLQWQNQKAAELWLILGWSGQENLDGVMSKHQGRLFTGVVSVEGGALRLGQLDPCAVYTAVEEVNHQTHPERSSRALRFTPIVRPQPEQIEALTIGDDIAVADGLALLRRLVPTHEVDLSRAGHMDV
eukprot:s2009_g7.t1